MGRGGRSRVGAGGGGSRGDDRGKRRGAGSRGAGSRESVPPALAPRAFEDERMTSPLVECVPNFSEGRDPAVLDALRAAIVAVAGVRLLDMQADASHHRSVFTFVAPPVAAVEAAFRAIEVATARIDLTKHRREHPRIGATHLVPFVPARRGTMDACGALASQLAERVGRELAIPVYLYAEAARRPERERLPDSRQGGLQGVPGRLATAPAAEPDFGPKRL